MEHATGLVLPNSGHNRDAEASKMGMWLFLFTELLLFGGLFLVYMVYRLLNAEAFLLASFELNIALGTINTVVLLVSSMTIAMAITAIQKGDRKTSVLLLYVTVALSLVFMVIKFFEWSAKINYGYFPGMEVYQNLPAGPFLFPLFFYDKLACPSRHHRGCFYWCSYLPHQQRLRNSRKIYLDRKRRALLAFG